MSTADLECPYAKGFVVSKDGTTIGYRQFGKGTGVILVHGGMKTSQDFMKLAVALSDAFTVYAVDRRGRGLSGPHGDEFSVDKEVDDVQALIAKTGARSIFGLSAGALVVLRTARATPALERVALYEPPFSIDGSAPTSWLGRYEQELARGHPAAALITAMKGMQVMPMFVRLPRFILVPTLSLVMRAQGDGHADDVPIRTLTPTLRYDVEIVKEMGDTLHDYKDLQARVLLLGGTKSPAFLNVALDGLERMLPRVERVIFPDLGHNGPEDDGKPDLVAQHLHRFFG
ncbi:MAG: alpha/beta hydrolase [Isosphaeraceae bacterium]